MELLSSDSESEYDSSFDPSAVRNIPTDNCKYVYVWKRLKAKLSIRFAAKRLNDDIRLYGSSVSLVDESGKVRDNLDGLL